MEYEIGQQVLCAIYPTSDTEFVWVQGKIIGQSVLSRHYWQVEYEYDGAMQSVFCREGLLKRVVSDDVIAELVAM